MRRKTWAGAIAVAATCALVGAASGIATSSAASTAASTAKASKISSGATGRPFGGPGGMSVHSVSAQLNKAGTAFITVTTDQGTVTAISGNDITLHEGTKTVTYKDVTVTVPDGATVTRDDATASLSDIKVGDRVSISSSSDGTVVRASDPTYTPTAPAGGRFGHGGPGGPPPTASSSSAG
jgi:GTPase involved in cell partitioning and DNA repair